MTEIEYYRDLILAMLPPGAYDISPGGIIYSWAEAQARILATAEIAIGNLQDQVTPHNAGDCLPEWEALLDAPSDAGASVDERQAALVARWRMAIGVRLFGIRSVLGPILRPTHQFKDTCDDSDVSWRYEQVPGAAGLFSEAPTLLKVEVPALGDGRWDAANKNQAMLLLPIVDRNDAVVLEVQLMASAIAANGLHAGLTLYQDDENAYMFGVYQTGGLLYFALHRIEDNVLYLDMAKVAIPGPPQWLVLSLVNGVVEAAYGAGLGALTLLAAHDVITIKPRKVGLYATNDAVAVSDIDVDDVQIRYAEEHNNVEIIETPLSLIQVGQEDQIFFYYIHRDPSDGGSYDIQDGQRMLDKIKSAHTLGIVGESDCARWDDPYTLYDRDIYSA